MLFSVRYLLAGNYGVSNLGDEALKEYFASAFPGVEWIVLSANPEEGEVVRFPAGVHSLLRTKWTQTLSALRSSNGLVFGGGTLFTDTESVHACFVWFMHALFCILFRKPYFLAFQGVGPFRTRMGEQLARAVFRRAQFISVRDAASLQCVEAWKLNKKIVQSFDPVLSLLQEHSRTYRTENVLILIPRWNSGTSFRKQSVTLARSRSWEEVVILSLEPGNLAEQAECASLQRELNSIASTRIIAIHSLDDLVREVGRGAKILSERYHGALTALALKKDLEVCSRDRSDKLGSLPVSAKQESLLEAVRRGKDALIRAFSGTVKSV